MAENILTVNDGNFEQEVLKSDMPVLVDFWAEWCAPCRVLAPRVEEVAREYVGKVKVAKLNVDDNTAIASRYNIRGIPTLLLFRGGGVKGQIVGAVPKEEIEKLLDGALS
ncbi:MAG: thioredoxin [Acidobacteria bacterium]|nr:thioredoxin [Acidobacteriota bacterium]